MGGFEPYRRSIKLTDAELGHQDHCDYKSNAGSGCLCDGTQSKGDIGAVRRKKIVWAMELAGWTTERKGEGLAFSRNFGKHIVWVARVLSGWSHRWQRGVGYTITESGGFGTVAACLTDLWEHVVTFHDMSDATMLENIQFRLAAAKAAPPATDTPAPPVATSDGE